MGTVFDLRLTSRYTWMPELHLVWDADNGTLGKDTQPVLQPVIDEAVRDGVVPGLTPPSYVPVTDPLKVPSEMVLVLAMYWFLPDELAALAPPETPQEFDSEVVY